MKLDFSEFLQAAESFQPLKDWGFTLSAKHEGSPVVSYASKIADPESW